MSDNTVLFECINSVAKITLNRPEVFNSINRPTALLFQEHLKICKEDDTIRAIYITGLGKAFCAGQDLKEVTNPETDFGFERILAEHYNPIIKLIRTIEKPVIVAVNGVAAGAGANIALACDIVLASEKASFIQAFSKIGLIPDSGGTFMLTRLVGFQKAMALAMLGDKVSATEAERIGMVYKVLSIDTFESESWRIAEKLASMPTRGLGLTKRAMNRALENNLEQQLEFEQILQIEAGHTEDYKEGVTAFVEKRQPVFKGK